VENTIRHSSNILVHIHLISSFITQNDPPDTWKTLLGIVRISSFTSIYYRVSSLKMNHLTTGKHNKAYFAYPRSHPSNLEFHHSKWTNPQVETTRRHGSQMFHHIHQLSSFNNQNEPHHNWKTLIGMVHISLAISIYHRVSSLNINLLTIGNTARYGSDILIHLPLFRSFMTHNEPPDKWKTLWGIVRISSVTSI